MKLGVPQATLCSLLKQRETVTAACDGEEKQMHMGEPPEVEAAQSHNVPFSRALARTKLCCIFKQSAEVSKSKASCFITY